MQYIRSIFTSNKPDSPEKRRKSTKPSPPSVTLDVALFKQLLKSTLRNDDNICISPYSIKVCLSMVREAVQGAARTELDNGIDMDSVSVSEMSRSLRHINNEKVSFMDANSIWSNGAVLPEFVQAIEDHYEGQRFELPSDAEPINNWVSVNTNGMIKRVMDDISDDAIAVLVNVAFFKGDWENPFPVNLTRVAKFNKTQDANFMEFEDDQTLPYHEGPYFQAVRLPYARGGEGKNNIDCTIILPNKEHTLDSLLSSHLTTAVLERVLASDGLLESKEGSLTLPRFKIECSIDNLKDALSSALGVKSIFSKGAADFTPMVGNELKDRVAVSRVIHKVVLEVNETGATGAAVTAAEFVNECCYEKDDTVKPFVMVVNRPFLAIIHSEKSVLFMAAVRSIQE